MLQTLEQEHLLLASGVVASWPPRWLLRPAQCLLYIMCRELSYLFLMADSPGLGSNPHGILFASVHAGIALEHLALSFLGFRWHYVPKSFRPLKKLFPNGLELLPIPGDGSRSV